ncbi:uncharacterized protein LOC120638331 [Ornithorhynchus anatinus]|uniref:uncharacterized protein LOC120638331 n=1 Tax=Ornithorhynchus anatinus TaxID=9258 RepID=UPI0019D4C690|nr:uncharacterized protein LOC120638331 [Ornithorhynchus anatinus]
MIKEKEEKEEDLAHCEKSGTGGNNLPILLDLAMLASSEEGSALRTYAEDLTEEVATSFLNPSQEFESVESDSSFGFQKVSAVLINISESSFSENDIEHDEDTDLDQSEASTDEAQTCDKWFPHPLPKKHRVSNEGNKLMTRNYCSRPQPGSGSSYKTTLGLRKLEGKSGVMENVFASDSNLDSVAGRKKQQESVLCTESPLLLPYKPTQKGKGGFSEASERVWQKDKGKNVFSEQDAGADSSSGTSPYSEKFSGLVEDLEQQVFLSVVGRGIGQKDLGIDFPSGQNKEKSRCPSPESSSMSLQPKNSKVKCQVFSFPLRTLLTPHILPALDTKHSSGEDLGGAPFSADIISQKTLATRQSMPHIAELDASDAKNLPTRIEDCEKESVTELPLSKKANLEPVLSISPRELTSHPKNCSARNGDDDRVIQGRDLPYLSKDTLSEILSPVNEVLSYGSADLPSSNQRDFSIPSEELPTPPEEHFWTQNDETNFDLDFPSPPEEVLSSEDRHSPHTLAEESSINTQEMPLSPDDILSENSFPLPLELENSCCIQDRHNLVCAGAKVNSFEEKEESPQHLIQKESITSQTQELTCLSTPSFHQNVCKSPDVLARSPAPLYKIEEDNNSLAMYNTGNGVLVEAIETGTLKFKECPQFAQDLKIAVEFGVKKGCDGNQERVECLEGARNCDEFVRVDQISLFLADQGDNSAYIGDENPFSASVPSEHSKCLEDDSFFMEIQPKGSSSESADNPSRAIESSSVGAERGVTNNQSVPNQLTFPVPQFLRIRKEKKPSASPKNEEEELLEHDVLPVKDQESDLKNNSGEQKVNHSLFQSQERDEIVDIVSTELTKRILEDTLAVFSELPNQATHRYANQLGYKSS